jgi:hypothetical protein
MLADVRRNFPAAIVDAAPPDIHRHFHVDAGCDGVSLTGDGAPVGTFPVIEELLFFLEELLENALVERLGEWVGFHAGAAVAHESAIIVAGRPDSGKTTSMFQLAELGLELLCEEVTPVDPATRTVHPFPQVLTLDRAYMQQYLSLYPAEHGVVSYYGPTMARYAPTRLRAGTARLGAIVLPSFHPSFERRLEETRPAMILADLLQCCFPPAHGDERLFDSVIRIVEGCRLFTLRSCDIGSARTLLGQVVGALS